jgi:peptidoglycan/LPS O-acetylase OafA/YrhL
MVFSGGPYRLPLWLMAGHKNSYFPALTGIRALAAYLVFFHHFIPVNSKTGSYSLDSLFGEMHIGVTFFFVLSGFLIHHRYAEKFESGTAFFSTYFFARIARIMPLYLLLTILTFAIVPFFKEVNLAKWGLLGLLNITLLKGLFSATKFAGIDQAWSLSVEFCFYALAPFLFFRLKNHWIKYLGLYFLFLVLIFGFSWLLEILPFGSSIGNSRFYLVYTFPGRSFEFFAGCFLSAKLSAWSLKPSSFPLYTLLGSTGILAGLFCLSFLRQGADYEVQHPFGIIINNLGLPVFIVMFFRGLVLEDTWLKSFFSSAPMELLGKSSYAFYLVHVGIFEKLSHHFFPGLWWSFLSMNALAVLLF